jgi:hypothetical protein
MTDPITQPPESTAADETFTFDAEPTAEHAEAGTSQASREWMTQLQAMIDNIATSAAPVMREIGAKAAELAAIAGEKAGPFAQRAAEVTAEAGTKLAERGHQVAAELRRDVGTARDEPGESAVEDIANTVEDAAESVTTPRA